MPDFLTQKLSDLFSSFMLSVNDFVIEYFFFQENFLNSNETLQIFIVT